MAEPILPAPADPQLPPDHPHADIPFQVPCWGIHVTMTMTPYDESKKEKSVHHLVLGAQTEAEAIAAVDARYYPMQGPNGPASTRWTAERCIRLNRPDNDKTIVFKL